MSRKAQSVTEFALVAGMIILSLSVMQIYIARGLQGRYKQSADLVYRQAFPEEEGRQYEPYYLQHEFQASHASDATITYDKGTDEFEKVRDAQAQRSGKILQLPYSERRKFGPGPIIPLP